MNVKASLSVSLSWSPVASGSGAASARERRSIFGRTLRGPSEEGGKVEELGIELVSVAGFDGSPNLAAGRALDAGATPKTGPPKTLLDVLPNEPVGTPPKPDDIDGEATSLPKTEVPVSFPCLLAGAPIDDTA